MKKSLLLFLFLVVLSTGVFGLSVELTFPVNNAVYVDSNNVIFKCKAIGEDLRFIELYTNVNGWSKKGEIANPSSNTDVTFSVQNINNGDYIWNCKAIDGSEGVKFSSNNRSFSVNLAPNNPPTYKGGILSQTWNMNTERRNAFDLDDFFTDLEGNRLSYSVNGNDNVIVTIDTSNVVSFSQPSNWFGTERVYFTANDGKGSVNSNVINLTVKTSTSQPDQNTNNAPTIDKIPDQNVSLDMTTWYLDLGNYGRDTEDSSSKLNWFVDGVNTDLVKVDIDNVLKRAKFTSQGKEGTDTITFTVSDSGGLNASQSLKVVIYGAVNRDEFNNFEGLLGGIEKIDDPGFFVKAIIPVEKDVFIKTNEIKVFKLETTRKGDVQWYLDGELLGETRNSFSFNSNQEKEYNLSVYVTDLEETIFHSWKIIVKNEEPIVIATQAEPTPAVCGNGIIEGGENCLNCDDAKCKDNEKCENELCVENRGLFSITGGVVRDLGLNKDVLKKTGYGVLGVLLFLAFSIVVVRRKNKAKYTHLTKLEEEEGFLKRVQKRLRAWDQRRVERKEQRVSLKNQESRNKEEIVKTAPSTLSIIGFIKDSVAQGHSRGVIKRALKEKGWSRLQIWRAFRKIRT
ncbi:MAG: hypothetical protein AABW58_03915 [Nanoarchaeota archaeon]